MALVKCSDCGRSLSTSAKSCPYCGNTDISYSIKETNRIAQEDRKMEELRKKLCNGFCPTCGEKTMKHIQFSMKDQRPDYYFCTNPNCKDNTSDPDNEYQWVSTYPPTFGYIKMPTYKWYKPEVEAKKREEEEAKRKAFLESPEGILETKRLEEEEAKKKEMLKIKHEEWKVREAKEKAEKEKEHRNMGKSILPIALVISVVLCASGSWLLGILSIVGGIIFWIGWIVHTEGGE